MVIAIIALSILSSTYILPRIVGFLYHNARAVNNYKGKAVFNCGGIFLTINALIACSFILYADLTFLKASNYNNIIVAVIGILSASFAGYVDDNSRDRTKGIAGHFKALQHNTLTSGIIKAFIGLQTSFLICLIMGYDIINFLINFTIIPLSQNFINLLDLRPARAIKAYIALSLMLTPFLFNNINCVYIIFSIIISLIFYLPYELDETLMMGDTGANMLGIVLGITIISVDSITIRLIFFIFLVSIQLYAEKKSISLLIEKSSFLSFIDMLGRRKFVDDKNP